MVEMVHLAEEARHICGQRSNHGLAFIQTLTARHQSAIIAECLDANSPQPLGEARIDEIDLVLRQCNARAGMDELGDLTEVRPAHREFAVRYQRFAMWCRGGSHRR